MPEPSIYDYLSKYSLSEVTTALLNDSAKSTNIDPVNVKFWQGVITVERILSDSRTYPHGLPIPETGAVHIETIADAANATITPSGTEIWLVQNLNLDGCTASFKDSDGNLSTILSAPPAGAPTPEFAPLLSKPFYLSATMSLFLANASGQEQTPSIAYLKVSL